MIGALVMYRDIGTQWQADPEVLAQDQVGSSAGSRDTAVASATVPLASCGTTFSRADPRKETLMTRDEIRALDDRGMVAWDSHDTDGFVALFADDFVYTDDGTPQPLRSKD